MAIMLGSMGLDIWDDAVYICLDIVIYGRIRMSKILYSSVVLQEMSIGLYFVMMTHLNI